MEVKTLKAQPREAHGSRAAARLRRQGKIPGIVYGHKVDPAPITVDRRELEIELELGTHIVNLDVGGKSETCLIKDVQYDHLGIEAMHIDLARVDLNELVRLKVPLEFKGTAKGIGEGGVVTQQLMDIEVECTVASIPDVIRVNIADLGLNQMLHIRELALPEGVKAVADPEAIVAMCREPLAAAPAATAAVPGEEEAKEPEVIAKGKVLEEGEEAEEKK